MADTSSTTHEVRRRFRVRGRVQGVGFRAWTLGVAAQLGLRGTVRNCPDGTVEVDAGGTPGAVDRLGGLLADGPALAEVEEVTELEPATQPLPESFRLAH